MLEVNANSSNAESLDALCGKPSEEQLQSLGRLLDWKDGAIRERLMIHRGQLAAAVQLSSG